jgi:chorismate synthase
MDIPVGGRHDPCIVPRIIPVAEAMLALVLMDCMLEQAKIAGEQGFLK